MPVSQTFAASCSLPGYTMIDPQFIVPKEHVTPPSPAASVKSLTPSQMESLFVEVNGRPYSKEKSSYEVRFQTARDQPQG